MEKKLNKRSIHFNVNLKIENINLGMSEDVSLKDAAKRISHEIKKIENSKELREECAKCFCKELGRRVKLYMNVMLAIEKGMKNVRIEGMNGMNYKKLLEDKMPVTFDGVGIEDGKEVERMWLADFVDGKWVEDYVVVRRDQYDIETDEDGAVFAKIENGRMLVKAPNIKYYRIPENVYRVAEYAFKDCPGLEEIDVPYMVSKYEIGNAFDHSCMHPRFHLWDWPYNCERSEELEKEIAEGWTDEHGFIYSQDRKRLLRAAPEWKEYWIPESVEKIERLAFVGCKYEDLHIPYTYNMNELPADEWPVFGSERVQGNILHWEKPYSEKD